MSHTSTAVGTGSGPADSVGFKPVAQTKRESQHEQTSSSIDDEEQGGDSDSSALPWSDDDSDGDGNDDDDGGYEDDDDDDDETDHGDAADGVPDVECVDAPANKDKSVFSRRIRCCG